MIIHPSADSWVQPQRQTPMGRPKRNVLAAAEESLTPPDSLAPNQTLVRVVKPEGNNLYTCELPSQKPVLLELAQRFRNTIWIRRGGVVLAERYVDGEESGRAVGEIVNVVRDLKLWKKQSYWYEFGVTESTRSLTVLCRRPQEFSKSIHDLSDSEDESTVGKMPPSDSEDD